jgi:two-component system LytT family response regulator
MKTLFNRTFSNANSFPVILVGKVLWLRARDITYLEGEGNYTFIHTSGSKKYLVSKTLKFVEETLNAGFIRVHKSYMINPVHILSRPESDQIELSCGRRIPIARRRIRETHEMLCHVH